MPKNNSVMPILNTQLRARMAIKGGRELVALLNELGPAIANKHLRVAIKAGLQPMLEAAKKEAPVDTGRLKETLIAQVSKKKQEIVGRIRPKKITAKMRAKIRLNGKPGALLYDAYYAGFTNYGTKFQRPQRWMNRAFSESREAAVEKFLQVLKPAVEAEVRALRQQHQTGA